MKRLSTALIALTIFAFVSCNENAGTDKNGGDSATTGLEGTREEASQLSNAPLDTSSGQSVKKEAIDSSHVKKDSLPVK